MLSSLSSTIRTVFDMLTAHSVPKAPGPSAGSVALARPLGHDLKDGSAHSFQKGKSYR